MWRRPACQTLSKSLDISNATAPVAPDLLKVLEVLSNTTVLVFSQWYLMELVGLLTGLGLVKLWHLIYPRRLTGFGMLVFFINLNLRDFQVKFLALFLLFTVIDGFEWFWMESLLKNFQLMLEFLKAPFLGPTPFLLYINDLNDNVICDTVIYANDTTLSVIRHLICGNNLNWSLNLNLNKILWTWVRSGLLISVLGKLSWFRLMGLITMVLLVWKWIGLFLLVFVKEVPFVTNLNGTSLTKTSRKIVAISFQ